MQEWNLFGGKRGKPQWDHIAAGLRTQGFSRPAKNCKYFWGTLMKRYSAISAHESSCPRVSYFDMDEHARSKLKIKCLPKKEPFLLEWYKTIKRILDAQRSRSGKVKSRRIALGALRGGHDSELRGKSSDGPAGCSHQQGQLLPMTDAAAMAGGPSPEFGAATADVENQEAVPSSMVPGSRPVPGAAAMAKDVADERSVLVEEPRLPSDVQQVIGNRVDSSLQVIIRQPFVTPGMVADVAAATLAIKKQGEAAVVAHFCLKYGAWDGSTMFPVSEIELDEVVRVSFEPALVNVSQTVQDLALEEQEFQEKLRDLEERKQKICLTRCSCVLNARVLADVSSLVGQRYKQQAGPAVDSWRKALQGSYSLYYTLNA
jgi:hypothetical protein